MPGKENAIRVFVDGFSNLIMGRSPKKVLYEVRDDGQGVCLEMKLLKRISKRFCDGRIPGLRESSPELLQHGVTGRLNLAEFALGVPIEGLKKLGESLRPGTLLADAVKEMLDILTRGDERTRLKSSLVN